MKRDRKDLQIIAMLGGSCPTRRVTDVRHLALSPALQDKVERVIYENRMLWEPWMESANSVEDLRNALAKRGFVLFPMKAKPILEIKDLHPSRQIDPLAMKRLEIKKN